MVELDTLAPPLPTKLKEKKGNSYIFSCVIPACVYSALFFHLQTFTHFAGVGLDYIFSK